MGIQPGYVAKDESEFEQMLAEVIPETSAAHVRVNFSEKKVQYQFAISGMQVSYALGRCAGDHELCKKILMVCYVRAEEGWSKEQLVEYRAKLLQQFNARTTGHTSQVGVKKTHKKRSDDATNDHGDGHRKKHK